MIHVAIFCNILVLFRRMYSDTSVNVRLSFLLILELRFYGCCHPCCYYDLAKYCFHILKIRMIIMRELCNSGQMGEIIVSEVHLKQELPHT